METPSRQFRVGCELAYDVHGPGAFILNVAAASNAVQSVREEQLRTNPPLPIAETTSSFDDKRQHRFRVNEPGSLQVNYSALVEVVHEVHGGVEIPEVVPGDLPTEVVPFLYPSRYCESDLLVRLANKEFGRQPGGFARVTAICNWIFENVEYLRGATDAMTSAYDTVTERAGVCRDFAHLAIALCRALTIPARFVAGYTLNLEPPDFHACFEAYLGDRWYFFDATRLAPQTGFVRIGTGRDAADASFATTFGPLVFRSIVVTMEQTAGPAAAYTTGAVVV
jgi:transglutaminase-like putative cysteine protease